MTRPQPLHDETLGRPLQRAIQNHRRDGLPDHRHHAWVECMLLGGGCRCGQLFLAPVTSLNENDLELISENPVPIGSVLRLRLLSPDGRVVSVRGGKVCQIVPMDRGDWHRCRLDFVPLHDWVAIPAWAA